MGQITITIPIDGQRANSIIPELAGYLDGAYEWNQNHSLRYVLSVYNEGNTHFVKIFMAEHDEGVVMGLYNIAFQK